jgi:uncharacterized protein YfaS (alpha-2-macroglobulin family)
MRGKKNYLLLAALLPLSLLTKANGDNGNRKSTEPVLQGCVADASTKKPVQGVTISITNTKGQEKKEFTTDASGNFKIPQMPVGEVIIVLEKKGYKTTRREGIIIKEGVSLKVNFDITNIKFDEDESDVFHPFLRMMEG